MTRFPGGPASDQVLLNQVFVGQDGEEGGRGDGNESAEDDALVVGPDHVVIIFASVHVKAIVNGPIAINETTVLEPVPLGLGPFEIVRSVLASIGKVC